MLAKYILEVPLGPTEPTGLNAETESAGIASDRRNNQYEANNNQTETEPNRRGSTPFLQKASGHLDKLRPSTEAK